MKRLWCEHPPMWMCLTVMSCLVGLDHIGLVWLEEDDNNVVDESSSASNPNVVLIRLYLGSKTVDQAATYSGAGVFNFS